MMLSDLESIEKRLEKNNKKNINEEEIEILKLALDCINNKKEFSVLRSQFSKKQLNQSGLLCLKPKIYVCMSSVPGRCKQLPHVVDSLLANKVLPDKIFINLCEKYDRFPEEKYDLSALDKYKDNKIITINSNVCSFFSFRYISNSVQHG